MSQTIVRKIEKKKGLYVIHGDDFEVLLSPTFYAEELLYVNKALSHNDCIRLGHLSRLSEPYEYSHRLLSRGAYSAHMMREKISVKFPTCDDINEIIYRLKEEGLINDEDYALAYKESKEAQLYGPNRILDELRFNKGINPEILKGLKFKSEDESLERLFNIADLRYKDLPYRRKVMKLEKYFIDRGFSKEKAKEYAKKASVNKKEQAKRFKMDLDKAKRLYSKKYEGYELKQRIIRSLLSKGYTMSDIEEAL